MKKYRFQMFVGSAILAAVSLPASAQDRSVSNSNRPAYYVADFEQIVPGAIKPYSEKVESTFQPYGGKFIVRGGELLSLEGITPKGRMIVIRFDSLERAKAWYQSAEYEKLKPIRWAAGKTNVYIIEGLPEVEALPAR
jgi:uncharacterized protein (DUF1330 family)